MTPLQLSICLHYHTSVTDAPWINSGAALVSGVMSGLVTDNLLIANVVGDSNSPKFQPTEKLHAFVRLLCATPLPEMHWVDPRTKEIAS